MATHDLIYHPAAELELLEAAEWYRERSELAAIRFGQEIESRVQDCGCNASAPTPRLLDRAMIVS